MKSDYSFFAGSVYGTLSSDCSDFFNLSFYIPLFFCNVTNIVIFHIPFLSFLVFPILSVVVAYQPFSSFNRDQVMFLLPLIHVLCTDSESFYHVFSKFKLFGFRMVNFDFFLMHFLLLFNRTCISDKNLFLLNLLWLLRCWLLKLRFLVLLLFSFQCLPSVLHISWEHWHHSNPTPYITQIFGWEIFHKLLIKLLILFAWLVSS